MLMIVSTCCSAFGALAHDAALDVFRTLPAYTSTERVRRLSWIVARNPAGWVFEFGNALTVCQAKYSNIRYFNLSTEIESVTRSKP